MDFEFPPKVVWSEGMPLWPQHLQQLDRYHEQYVARRSQAVHRHEWGVLDIQLDQDALSKGLIAVKRLVAMLQDGSLISCATGDPHCPPMRPIEEHYRPELGTLDVYVGVAREREGLANYSHDEGATATSTQAAQVTQAAQTTGATNDASAVPSRYRIFSRTLPDLVGTGEPARVEFARPQPVFRLGQESRDDFEYIKVAELTKNAAGQFVPVGEYVPPCIHISASSYVVEQLRKLTTALVEKDRILGTSSEPWQKSPGGSDAATLLRMAINPYVPWLEHVVDSPDLPPRYVFLELLKLGGQLAVFRNERPQWPRYDHVNLRGTFSSLFASLFDLLQVTLRTQRYSVDLLWKDRGYYVAALDESLLRCKRFFLCVHSGLPEPEVGERLPLLAKAASQNDLHALLAAATPGLRLHWTPSPPAELSIRPGEVCFAVDASSPYWARVLEARDVAVYLTQPFDPSSTSLRLVALAESEGGR
jgi:type VI secretion system protein ImpJ